MAISDEDLIRQLESVPLVESPDFRDAILARVQAPHPGPLPLGEGAAKRRVRVYMSLAWAAAAVIVIGLAVQRRSISHTQSAATAAPMPAEEWPIVARASSRADGATLTVRRNGDRFAVKGVVPDGRPVIDWDRDKLSMVETLPDSTMILQRQSNAAGPATVRLTVNGKEVLKITNFL